MTSWDFISQVTETFIKLSTLEEISEEDMVKKANLIVLIFEKTSPYKYVHKFGKYLFTKMNNTIEN